MDMSSLWSACLTAVLALIGWVLNNAHVELKRQQVLLNKTREEIAKEYITKSEVHADLNRVLDRLEALDAKLDRLIER